MKIKYIMKVNNNNNYKTIKNKTYYHNIIMTQIKYKMNNYHNYSILLWIGIITNNNIFQIKS